MTAMPKMIAIVTGRVTSAPRSPIQSSEIQIDTAAQARLRATLTTKRVRTRR